MNALIGLTKFIYFILFLNSNNFKQRITFILINAINDLFLE